MRVEDVTLITSPLRRYIVLDNWLAEDLELVTDQFVPRYQHFFRFVFDATPDFMDFLERQALRKAVQLRWSSANNAMMEDEPWKELNHVLPWRPTDELPGYGSPIV